MPHTSPYCLCHDNQETMIACGGQLFCKYLGKYHPMCVNKNALSSAYCKSCEREKLNGLDSMKILRKVVENDKLDPQLILDAMISHRIKTNATH